LRKFALSYPGAYEEFPWGERVVKVAKKVFVFLGCSKDGLSLSTKLVETNEEALEHKFAKPTGYNLGKSGWITATFPAGGNVPVELLKSWIDESYRTVAPKKLTKSLPPLRQD
jgi:predicted DNA-binding protein (MmcQ/YjbR family)